MTLTMIAVAGIVLGFLCLIVGFFAEGTQVGPIASPPHKSVRRHRKSHAALGKHRTA